MKFEFEGAGSVAMSTHSPHGHALLQVLLGPAYVGHAEFVHPVAAMLRRHFPEDPFKWINYTRNKVTVADVRGVHACRLWWRS